jgi:hypothetical protein
MGLGLSIARAIVEGYGGSIAAVNRDGGGASVEVRLPMVTGLQGRVDRARMRPRQSAGTGRPGGGRPTGEA